MPDEIEIPDGAITRRTFVAGAAVAGGVACTAATVYALAAPLAIVKTSEAQTIDYMGAHKAAGPAPRGIPWLPVDTDANGNLIGRTEFLGENILEWYRYCGHEGSPGLQPDGWTGPNTLQYFITEDKVAQGFNPWYRSLAEKRASMNVKDFENQPVGQGAAAIWRSDPEDPVKSNIVTVIIIKVPKDDLESVIEFEGIAADKKDAAIALIKKTGFIGYVGFCTHFCCVPGWKEAPGQAIPRGAWDMIFCTCHMSQYDPITIKAYSFLQEQGGGGAEGGH